MSSTPWRHRDHTRGSLATSLFVLALPLLASGVLGSTVFQIAELSFLARLGEAPLAAVTITNQTVRQVYFLIAMGLSFATQSLIARAVGAGDLEQAEHVAGQSIALGLLLSAAVAAVGWAFPDALFGLPGPDPSFAEHGVPYLRLVFLLNFGVVGTMLFAAILGGAGDTTTPLLVQLVQSGVAILAEWLLIFGNLGAPALGVRGVALGAAAGQAVAMGLGVWLLFRGKSRVRLRRDHVIPDWRTIGALAGMSWLPAAQMIGGLATTFAFVRLCGSYGENVQAAYAISLRVGMIVPMVCFPLAGACSTLVGQALGAGEVRRAWHAVRIGLLAHGAIMGLLAAVVIGLRHELMALLSDDPEVMQHGAVFLLYSGLSFFFFAFYFVVMRSLQGAGDFAVPMAVTLGGAFFVTIPLSFWLARGLALGPTGIAVGQLVGAAFVTLATSAWFLTGRWTRRGAHSPPR